MIYTLSCIKDKDFGNFVGRYQYVLEMAKEKPDVFAEQLYEFYLKMASTIKKNNYYQRFFEFMSYLRKNKFDLNKMVAGVTTKGELIEVDDICPSLDFCVHEIEHIALMTPDKFTPDTMFKVYAKRGYKVSSWEDSEILRVTQQLHTNVVAYLTPYINEFTIDIIPQASFNPALGMYLKDVPILSRSAII